MTKTLVSPTEALAHLEAVLLTTLPFAAQPVHQATAPDPQRAGLLCHTFCMELVGLQLAVWGDGTVGCRTSPDSSKWSILFPPPLPADTTVSTPARMIFMLHRQAQSRLWEAWVKDHHDWWAAGGNPEQAIVQLLASMARRGFPSPEQLVLLYLAHDAVDNTGHPVLEQGRTRDCISGCSWGTDGVFHHHPYCRRYGADWSVAQGFLAEPETGAETAPLSGGAADLPIQLGANRAFYSTLPLPPSPDALGRGVLHLSTGSSMFTAVDSADRLVLQLTEKHNTTHTTHGMPDDLSLLGFHGPSQTLAAAVLYVGDSTSLPEAVVTVCAQFISGLDDTWVAVIPATELAERLRLRCDAATTWATQQDTLLTLTLGWLPAAGVPGETQDLTRDLTVDRLRRWLRPISRDQRR